MEGINREYNKPEFIHPDKLVIPDISFLTRVKMPDVIDLRDKELIVGILTELVEEEKRINPHYAGMFLHGSVSRGEASNGSDIDGVHVVQGAVLKHPDYQYIEPIRYRLDAIFKECFGIPVQDNRYIINISNEETFPRNTEELDKYSLSLGLTKVQTTTIDSSTHFSKRQKYSGNRLLKTSSIETGVHHFSYPRNGLFPWYSEYGLLERIDN